MLAKNDSTTQTTPAASNLLLNSEAYSAISFHGKATNLNTNNSPLHYVLLQPRAPITLNLFEAERYESAVIVQSLVGNLAYHSNQGRYEPRLAKRWSRETPTRWVFELRNNIVCENGEPITAENFKESLKRSLRRLTKSADVPVLSKLKGYCSFKENGGLLEGISVDANKIVFEFDVPVRSGLVEILSFAPFGYICSDNLAADGRWKDDTKFISSGPYAAKHVEIGQSYELERREDWEPGFSEAAPVRIVFSHTLPIGENSIKRLIVDSASEVVDPPEPLEHYPLMPEYLNAILLGNLDKGPFSKKETRVLLRSLVEKQKAKLPQRWQSHTKADSFYPNQTRRKASCEETSEPAMCPGFPVIIEGEVPEINSPRSDAWTVLEPALQEAGIMYKFSGDQMTWDSVTNENYDIRLRGASIGGGVAAWGLDILFHSSLGLKFPDPTGRVGDLVKQYERDQISDQTLTDKFLDVVSEDSAILPVSHFGRQLYFSSSIDRKSIDPTLSIMRFDQLKLL